MSESKEKTATGLMDVITTFLSSEKPQEVEETKEVKEEVELEEVKEEAPEQKEVKLESELAEGEYELKDGTTFKIDEAGNVVDVVAPTEEEAETEEAAKEEEDSEEMMTAKLSAEISELKEQITKLSEVEPLSAAPQKNQTVKLNKYSSQRPESTMDRVMARIANK